jgi:hypothetical protein
MMSITSSMEVMGCRMARMSWCSGIMEKGGGFGGMERGGNSWLVQKGNQ